MEDHFTVSRGNMVQTPRAKNQKLRTRIGLGLLVVGAGIAAMLIATPKAHADMDGYLTRLANSGYQGPIWKWQRMGYQICAAEAAGYSRGQIAGIIVATTGANIYTADAFEIIQIADEELCSYSSPNTLA